MCLYTTDTDADDKRYLDLIRHPLYKKCKKDPNIQIVRVYAGADKFCIKNDKVFLPCPEEYAGLSVKTYELINRCFNNYEFDVLLKFDVSLVGYINNTKAGYRKEVRECFYDLDRVFNLILDDTFFRNFKDYGGALLQGKGSRDGHYVWAKQMNIQNYDYDSVFSSSVSPHTYSGKFYFLSREFCKYVKDNGQEMAYQHRKHLGGSEDLMIGRLYEKFKQNEHWCNERKYKNTHKKFTDKRDELTNIKSREKSVFIVNDDKRYVWFTTPKVASRSIYEVLNLKTPSSKFKLNENEVREKENYFTNFPEELPCRLDYFKFAFVRNPWDRLLSTYNDKVVHCNGTEWELPFYKKFQDKSFEYFVDYLYDNVDDRERHVLSQISVMGDLSDLDFIGRYENLENDVKYVLQILGIPVEKLPHRNKTIQTEYQQYYTTTKLKRRVEYLYWEDIKYFEYEF